MFRIFTVFFVCFIADIPTFNLIYTSIKKAPAVFIFTSP